MKIYTKTGDDGSTGLIGNIRVRKDHPRIEAYGTVDELNALLGLISAHLSPSASEALPWIEAIQNDLFVVGAILATSTSDSKVRATLPPQRTTALENQIDGMEKELSPLKAFILPRGSAASSYAHTARAVCRRAERRVVALASAEKVDSAVVPYLNRLSDFLFVAARWINQRDGGTETPWLNPGGSIAGAGPQPGVEQDRLGATLKKLEQEKQSRQTLFEKATSDIQKKKEQAERLFRKNIDQIKKEGGPVEPPPSPFDLD